MESGSWRSGWCEVSFPGERSVLRLKDAGPASDPVALREKYRRMPEAEIVALGGKRARRSEVLAAGIEAFNRGMLPENEQARLAEMLREEDEARQEGGEEARFRARFGVTREEAEAFKGGAA